MILGIVGPITLQSLRTRSWRSRFAAHRRNRNYQRQQLIHVVNIRRRHARRQRDAIGIGQHMMLTARFAAIGGVRAGLRPPKTARTEAESITARDQSILSAWRKWSSNRRWTFGHTPAAVQSR